MVPVNLAVVDEKQLLQHKTNETTVQLPSASIQDGRKSANRRVIHILAAIYITSFLYLHTPVISALSCGHFQLRSSNSGFKQRAHDLLKDNPLIDSHVDLPILIRALYNNDIDSEDFTDSFERGGMLGQVDLPRLNQGQYGGAFWSGYYECPADPLNFSDEIYYPIVKGTLEQLDLFHRLSSKYPHYFTMPRTATEALENFHSNEHKLISPFAIEGLHQIGNSFATLRLYHQLGTRYATLTHNCHNIYADAAALSFGHFLGGNDTIEPPRTEVATPYWGGLSKKGRVIVQEMNRLGMIVDLSHVSQDTMREVLSGQHNHDAPHSEYSSLQAEEDEYQGSIAPPFFSHSSAYAICPHPRNVPDDVLQLVKQRRSVVMVNINPGFISCTPIDSESGLPDFYPKNNTLAQVVRHITYIGNLIGYDYVGLGTDFDGIQDVPVGLEDVGKMPDLVAALLEQGISDIDVIKVIGGNVMRVWSDVDKVAERLQKEGLRPAED